MAMRASLASLAMMLVAGGEPPSTPPPPSPPPSIPCVPTHGQLVRITFDNATLIRSNLGGHGGPHEPPSSTDQYLQYSHVGTLPDGSAIDLRVANLTAYHAYNPSINAISRKGNGSFGVVNLLGPRTTA